MNAKFHKQRYVAHDGGWKVKGKMVIKEIIRSRNGQARVDRHGHGLKRRDILVVVMRIKGKHFLGI